jgi:hypothetical protein
MSVSPAFAVVRPSLLAMVKGQLTCVEMELLVLFPELGSVEELETVTTLVRDELQLAVFGTVYPMVTFLF